MEVDQTSEEADKKNTDSTQDAPQIKLESVDVVSIKLEPQIEETNSITEDLSTKNSDVSLPTEEVHVKEEHGDSHAEDDDNEMDISPMIVTQVKSEPVGCIEDSTHINFCRSDRIIRNGKEKNKQNEMEKKSKAKNTSIPEDDQVVKKKKPRIKKIKGLQYRKSITITEEQRKIELKEMLHLREEMQFVCQDCAVYFVNEEVFKEHLKRHINVRGNLACNICPTRLTRMNDLKLHKTAHYRRYLCQMCGEVFRYDKSIIHHIEKVHGRDFILNVFVCLRCDDRFWNPRLLVKHIEDNHPDVMMKKCEHCKMNFFDKSTLDAHVLSHSEESIPSPGLKCETCGSIYPSHWKLRQHRFTHERSLECDNCGELCRSNTNLRDHEAAAHLIKPRSRPSVRCPECGRKFADMYAMKCHHKRMHEVHEKKYECEDCGRRYFSKGEVRDHILWSHMSHWGHVCWCGRRFRCPSRLQQHKLTQHLHLPPTHQQIPCTGCDKVFAAKALLKRHINRSHKEQPKYPCEECGARFKTKSYVQVHYNVAHLNMTSQQARAAGRGRKRCGEEARDEFVDCNAVTDDEKITVPLFDAFKGVMNGQDSPPASTSSCQA